MKKSVGVGVNTSQNTPSHSQSFVGVGQDQGLAGARDFSVKLRNSAFFRSCRVKGVKQGREIAWYLGSQSCRVGGGWCGTV